MSAVGSAIARLFGKQISSTEAETMVTALLPSVGRTPPERGVTGMLRAYSQSPWLRAVTSKVARSVGSTSWRLYTTKSTSSGRYYRDHVLQAKGIETRAYRRKEIDIPEGTELAPVLDHPMLRLLNAGAGGFPGATGRMLTQLYLELTGEAFWVLEVQGGVPVGYWIIPPTWVQEVPSPSGSSFILEANGKTLPVPREFMLWFLDPNPAMPYSRGTGPMRTLGDEIDTDDYAAKFTRAFFYNNAQPNILISAQGLNKEDAERFEIRWVQRLRGFLNAHRPFFLNRDVKVTQLTQKFAEMQLIELRKFERDMLINTKGVPPEIFGIIENSNRATIDAADYLFSRHVVVPALEFLRTFLQTELIPRYDERFILGYDSPVEEDQEFHLNVAKAAPWALTMNEWRALAGQDAVDYGEVHVFKLAEEARPPDLIGPVDVIQPPAPERSLIEAAKYEVLRLRSSNASEEGVDVSPARSSWTARGGADAAKTAHSEASDGCACGCQDVDGPSSVCTGTDASVPEKARTDAVSFRDRSGTVWKQIGGESAARLAEVVGARMAEEIVIAFNELRGAIDMNALIAALEAGDIEGAIRIITMADVEGALEPARQTLRTALIAVGEAAAAEVAEALGVDMSFDMISPAVLQELQDFGAGMVTNVSEESIAAMREVLSDGYANGRSPGKIAKQVRDSIGLTRPQVKQMLRLYDEWVEAFGEDVADSKLVKWALKKIRDRADTITFNELAYAANRGQEMVWEFGVKEGFIDPARTWRVWQINPGACDLCVPMDGARALIGQPYPNGLLTPNDIHINCHCYEVLLVQ